MSIIEDLSSLTTSQIENAEKLTTQWVFQAMVDFGMEAYSIFHRSPDDVKDIAEDITREALDRLPGFNVSQRVYGTVDYKKARYLIFSDAIMRQALFVDSKAEKDDRTATVQMSQTSLRVRQSRAGSQVDEPGLLPSISNYHGKQYLTTTVFLHFLYLNEGNIHRLQSLTLACLPNGTLQDIYNPSAADSIWLAGRNAPTLGEDFRVRLSFVQLEQKARWRVQRLRYDAAVNECQGTWSE